MYQNISSTNDIEDERTKLIATNKNNNNIAFDSQPLSFSSCTQNNTESNREKSCPTCKGSGKVFKSKFISMFYRYIQLNNSTFSGEETQLIALIPLSDSRLKPKRL